jgi:hypothetical protein
MPDVTYQPKVYRTQGGNALVVADGGVLAGVATTGSPHMQLRARKTIAEINAGITLLPAVVGYRYRVTDAKAIAVGGAVTAVTTVDVKGTVAAGAVILVSFAQANLTQSTVVRAGATGGTVLANGASFVTLDANTAVTVIKAGSDITVATHVDIFLDYVIEAA